MHVNRKLKVLGVAQDNRFLNAAADNNWLLNIIHPIRFDLPLVRKLYIFPSFQDIYRE